MCCIAVAVPLIKCPAQTYMMIIFKQSVSQIAPYVEVHRSESVQKRRPQNQYHLSICLASFYKLLYVSGKMKRSCITHKPNTRFPLYDVEYTLIQGRLACCDKLVCSSVAQKPCSIAHYHCCILQQLRQFFHHHISLTCSCNHGFIGIT